MRRRVVGVECDRAAKHLLGAIELQPVVSDISPQTAHASARFESSSSALRGGLFGLAEHGVVRSTP